MKSINEEKYNNLLQRLKLYQGQYLKYSSGLALGKLENIQLAKRAQNECRNIRLEIKLLENETNK